MESSFLWKTVGPTDNLPPALAALIMNSLAEQECPSSSWLITKLDRPIDVKRAEQQELENDFSLKFGSPSYIENILHQSSLD